jgi:hypothetical protein
LEVTAKIAILLFLNPFSLVFGTRPVSMLIVELAVLANPAISKATGADISSPYRRRHFKQMTAGPTRYTMLWHKRISTTKVKHEIHTTVYRSGSSA